MHKPELAAAIAAQTGLNREQAGEALNTLLDQVTLALSKGERVALPGLGSFTRNWREARTGINPQSGATVQIAGRNAVNFKAAKALREALNA